MAAPQSPNLVSLGTAIRERRKALDLTQQQLAERLGWSQERVSVLETGKYGLPSLPLLAHLSQALELPLLALIEAVGFGPEAGTQEQAAVEGRRSGGIEDALLFTLQRLLGIQALTLKDAMNQASDLMAQAMGADKVDLFLYEGETDSLVALGTSNTPMGRQQQRVGLDRVPMANGGRQVQVYQTGREYYTGHADQDPEMDRGVVHALGVRSVYAVPLRVDGSIRGILVAESVHPDRFSAGERDFFETASRWVGMVVQRAELHEELTRRTAEETRHLVAEEMVGTVAHDLRNQITPIKAQIDLLLRRLQREGHTRDAERVAQVAESMNRLHAMVTDLLDASRLESGIFSVRRRPADLVDLDS